MVQLAKYDKIQSLILAIHKVAWLYATARSTLCHIHGDYLQRAYPISVLGQICVYNCYTP